MALIKERLDRAVANHYWMLCFPKATVEHFLVDVWDHCSILLNTTWAIPSNWRPFRFLEAWAFDQTSYKVVEKAWNLDWKDGMECHQLRKSLFNIIKVLQKWNREYFGFAKLKSIIWKLS